MLTTRMAVREGLINPFPPPCQPHCRSFVFQNTSFWILFASKCFASPLGSAHCSTYFIFFPFSTATTLRSLISGLEEFYEHYRTAAKAPRWKRWCIWLYMYRLDSCPMLNHKLPRQPLAQVKAHAMLTVGITE